MMTRRYIGLFVLMMVAVAAWSQKAEREHIRKGNKAFKDSTYINADINYRKALDVNPGSTVAMYNLGNTLLQQNKLKEAMEQYADAARIEKDKKKLAQIYHNIGVIQYSQKDYAKAVEAYKQALRNNPKDDETRYNLALAQKMLKDQQQQQPESNQNENKDEQQQQQQQQQNEQQQQQQEQQQQSAESEQENNQMSKENAEQLLNSIMQDEKETQEKVKQQQPIQGVRLEKDW
ncbi:MAG: tetratricopeptide repeat protein [Bacteroides sp.]|nr:tetratricopeptide repeat protein [Bacteroides sp.]